MIAALTEDLVVDVCLAVLVVVTAWKAAGWWQRRQALQAFAATRGWRWRGFLDSGAHYPYSRLEAALARHQHLSVETESSSLLVEATGRLKVQEVPAFLDSAVSLANALVEDTRAAELKPL